MFVGGQPFKLARSYDARDNSSPDLRDKAFEICNNAAAIMLWKYVTLCGKRHVPFEKEQARLLVSKSLQM